MNKPISKNVHVIIDYPYAATVPFLPEAVEFDQLLKAKHLCRLLGVGALSYTLLTKAKWGLFKLLPFKQHLIIDFSVSVVAAAAPWLLGFSKKRAARNTLLAVGLAGLTAALLTDPNDIEEQANHYFFI